MPTIFQDQKAFTDRRAQNNPQSQEYSGPNRRQFSDSREGSNPEVAELAQAVDQYKLNHRRKFITYEELHSVISGLGYKKTSE